MKNRSISLTLPSFQNRNLGEIEQAIAAGAKLLGKQLMIPILRDLPDLPPEVGSYVSLSGNSDPVFLLHRPACESYRIPEALPPLQIVFHLGSDEATDRRDEQIADLKALLYRAAGVIEHSVVDTYFHDNHDVTKLQGEIEKALV